MNRKYFAKRNTKTNVVFSNLKRMIHFTDRFHTILRVRKKKHTQIAKG